MNEREVLDLYQSILGRPPENEAVVNHWIPMEWATAARLILASPEASKRPINFPLGSRAQASSGIMRLQEAFVSTRCRAEGVVFDRTGHYNNPGFLKLNADIRDVILTPSGVVADYAGIIRRHCLKGHFTAPFDGNSFNYYHWLVESMLSTFLLREADRDFESIISIGALGLTSWQQEFLTRLSIRTHVVDGDACDAVAVEYLHWREQTDISLTDDLDVRRFSTFMKSHFAKCSFATRKIYVVRTGARQVTNEVEVRFALENVGFTAMRLENMTVEEQATAFSCSDVIVGPHGAGLANLIFAEPGTKVLELMPSAGCQRPFFQQISEKLGLKYDRLLCCSDTNTFDGPMTVDVDMLISALSEVDASAKNSSRNCPRSCISQVNRS